MTGLSKITSKQIIQWLVKICLTLLALYLVYRKIDKAILLGILQKIQFIWLIATFILFNISKVFSAIRLRGLLGNIGIDIEQKTNLKLYYQGMFYNLFLPGGIGGDGFKTYVLNTYKQAPLKKIIGTMLYDRLSGLIMLCLLAFIIGSMVLNRYQLYFIVATILCLPVGYVFTKLLFPSHTKNFIHSQVYSLGVQMSQLLSVICILKALGIGIIAYFSYLLLFLISSVAAVIPFTIGGAGARELVFLYGEKLTNTNAETGISIGLIFFCITAISSFLGAFIKRTAK